jgi:hypothetical protein
MIVKDYSNSELRLDTFFKNVGGILEKPANDL